MPVPRQGCRHLLDPSGQGIAATFDQQRVKIAPVDVAKELRKGTPSIELNPGTGQKRSGGLPTDENTIVVGVWMLQPGEELIEALHELNAAYQRADKANIEARRALFT